MASASSSTITMYTSNADDSLSPYEAGIHSCIVLLNTSVTIGFKQTIVSLTEQVLAAASFGDFETYKKLVDFDATCFEPETYGSLIKGLEIHRFYFDSVLPKNSKTINTCMLNPVVHSLGPDAACIVYTRYTQYLDRHSMPHTLKTEETRIWHLKDDRWVNVHFHHS